MPRIVTTAGLIQPSSSNIVLMHPDHCVPDGNFTTRQHDKALAKYCVTGSSRKEEIRYTISSSNSSKQQALRTHGSPGNRSDPLMMGQPERRMPFSYYGTKQDLGDLPKPNPGLLTGCLDETPPTDDITHILTLNSFDFIIPSRL